MSSGFVSGGTAEKPIERNELWQKAEQELEAARQRKQEAKNHDGKSLYEVLQANKAAKQEAFEESIKLKNQFRSLDEDDVQFLDSVRAAESAKEQAVQRETIQRLEAFRQQQRQPLDTSADQSPGSSSGAGDSADLTWQTNLKKRHREQERALKGVKLAKLSRKTAEVSNGAVPDAQPEQGSASLRASGLQDSKATANLVGSTPTGLTQENDTRNTGTSEVTAGCGEAKPKLVEGHNSLGLEAYSSSDDG